MNSKLGFSLLEFMIALSLGAIICISILLAYGETYKTYLYNTIFLTRNHDLYLAMQVIRNDVSKAGVFGDFNLHYQGSNLYQVSSSSAPLCGNNKICELMPGTVGITSYLTDVDSIGNGFIIAKNSEILKLQFGTNDVKLIAKDNSISCQLDNSCLINKCNDEYYLNNLSFGAEGLESSSIYMLSSLSRAYLLKFNDNNQIKYDERELNLKLVTNGCPNKYMPFVKILSPSISKESPLQYSSFDPDIKTMSLSNFNTIYYFVGYDVSNNESGLYRVNLETTNNLSRPELVLPKVNMLKIDYILNFTALGKDNKRDEFIVCSTNELASKDSKCSNHWDKIITANISLISENNDLNKAVETISW